MKRWRDGSLLVRANGVQELRLCLEGIQIRHVQGSQANDLIGRAQDHTGERDAKPYGRKAHLQRVDKATIKTRGREKTMDFLITLFQDEDGIFIAECPAIPG